MRAAAPDAEEVADDEEFFGWYGPWAPLDPDGLVDLMAGFDRPWWIVGGWAIEAFTGARREHEDVDLSARLRHGGLPRARRRPVDLWSNHGGTLRPFNNRHPEVVAALRRPKDDSDLAVAWLLLGAAAQKWLVTRSTASTRSTRCCSRCPESRGRGPGAGRDMRG